MTDESKLKYELRRQLKTLKEIRGSGTELISVYIGPDYPVFDTMNKLKEECGQASNIKSKTTRKNVQDALEKIINYLKMFRKAPANGIAIFCGNVSRTPGKPDLQLYSIEPPQPLTTQFYRCDSVFAIEPLEYMVEAKDVYGLLVMDGREATIASLKGKQVITIRTLNSTAHSKVNKGGQSQRRYQRLVEEAIEKYYIRIGEAVSTAFVGTKNFKGLIVGGPGPAKEDFLKLAPFNYQIKVLASADTGYCDDYGIQELVTKSEDVIKEQEIMKEKLLVSRFIKEVVKDGLAAYGEKEVREALERGKVHTLLLSEELGWKQFFLKCSACGKEKKEIAREPPEEMCECKGKMRVVEEKNLVDELMKIAEEKGVPVEMISGETSEGSQFLNGFLGIGAILKYR